MIGYGSPMRIAIIAYGRYRAALRARSQPGANRRQQTAWALQAIRIVADYDRPGAWTRQIRRLESELAR